MPTSDAFSDIAPYYDAIMEEVDYDRWDMTTTALAELLPERFVHLDVACGTAKLVKRLRQTGWNSMGVDFSYPMLRAGRRGDGSAPLAVADLRDLPLRGGVDYVTCLFDSINFLLNLDDVRAALCQTGLGLKADGLLYFDIITERMVTEHFADQRWTEENGRFSTTWDSRYCRATATAETEIRVNTGAVCVLRERVYPREAIEQAVEDAGLHLLGVFDAKTWKKPRKKTERIDFIASKSSSADLRRRFRKVCADVRTRLH